MYKYVCKSADEHHLMEQLIRIFKLPRGDNFYIPYEKYPVLYQIDERWGFTFQQCLAIRDIPEVESIQDMVLFLIKGETPKIKKIEKRWEFGDITLTWTEGDNYLTILGEYDENLGNIPCEQLLKTLSEINNSKDQSEIN